MSNSTEVIVRGTEAALENRLPQMLDEVLGRLTKVGVERILQLAGEMTAARIEQPAEAHLLPGASGKN